MIQSRWQARMRNEEKASGIAPEPESDLDNMIQEITEKERLAEEGRDGDEKIKKAESERETAEHVRKQAMKRSTKRRKDPSPRLRTNVSTKVLKENEEVEATQSITCERNHHWR